MKTQKERAFIDLLDEHQRLVHKICRIYTDNPYDHEDLFQEIVIQLWRAYPNFRAESKFSTWAYRVALNTAMTLFRKREKQPKIDKEKDIFNLNIKAEITSEEEEKLQVMYEAIHKLNDVEKALIMMFLDDTPYKEITQILGITEGNVRIRIMRAKDKLKNLIQHK